MKYFILTLPLLILTSSCKIERNPKITSTVDIDIDIKAFFVDYEVGTKWIYKDTLNVNNFDTIELTQIEPYNTNRKGVLEKGYILHYKAKKFKDFKVSVGRGIENSFYIKMYTNVTGSGSVNFEYYDGEWADWLNYYDSIDISGNTYYEVIESESNNMYHYRVKISKKVGLVFYIYRDYSGGIAKGGDFHLIKTLKL